ncbi:olfactory receptor 2L3-like [Cavia porcellus]|uniref:olfactory receptor 2L3-like n=1 Tax=Cavia porcellus TaxID=10141 RepID=UPI002FE18143
MENYTQTPSDFILLGLFPSSRVNLVLFILIVPFFLMALAGNLAMVLLILLDAHLHIPMHILLSQLSLMDLMYICTTAPKMTSDFLSGIKSISFIGCGTKAFFFGTLAGSEGLILMSMAYDSYVAICFPLHYPIGMKRRVCVLMILGSWVMSAVSACAHTVYALHISYCRSRAINCFFCNVSVMVTLACEDTSIYEYTVFFSTVIFLLFFFLLIIVFSYGKVLLAVHHTGSQEGRKKSYSTCSTHLIVVTFYIVPFACTYFRPKSLCSPAEDKVLAGFYIILTPMLNPVIDRLRNKEVLGALERVTRRICSAKM